MTTMLVMAPKDDWMPRVRFAHESSGLSMGDLSKKAGFSRTYLSALLRGEIDKRGPSADSLRKIAEAAGVDPDWIVTGKGSPGAGLPATKHESGEIDVSAYRRTGDDPYPDREDALIVLGPHLDPRVKKLLLRLSGPEYEGYGFDDWLAKAKELKSKVDEVDRDWGKAAPAAAEESAPTKAPGRGKASA
ncbi:MAG TPA: helix-turn-helix transcriptional regulator [Polyangiaceae bacterium]|nr:helix-turn-helix transcriptional regulator [Polyangiaceae bacterium]